MSDNDPDFYSQGDFAPGSPNRCEDCCGSGIAR